MISYKIRLRPTKEQERQLCKSAGTARWAYNWVLSKQEESYKNGGKFISDQILSKELTKLKGVAEFSWLYEVAGQASFQAVKDACNAYKNFFTGRAKKPKFKSKKSSKPSFYNTGDKFKVKEKSVLLQKIGWVVTSEQLPIKSKYYNPRITFDGKYWYLSVSYEREEDVSTLTDEVIGIDLGVKELAICSDGRTYKNINKTKEVKRLEKKLRRLQRKSSRKYQKNKRGEKSFAKTRNIIKLEKEIKLVHRKLTNIRTNYLHQVSHEIISRKPRAIVLEDLNVKGMLKNRHLAKSIANQKLYEFKRQIAYKAEGLGIEIVTADRFFPSSKTCSNCGIIKKDLKLSDRVYHCECGLHIDRDLNAAINLKKYGEMKLVD